MIDIIAIVQARMGSTRLPGKILKDINGTPLIGYTLKRLQKSKVIDKVVLATSTNIENDPVEKYCNSIGIDCFRGGDNEDDVLDRFYKCSKKYDADIILRITGDCPLIDPEVINKHIEFYIDNDYDITINTWFKNSYPSGFDVEIFDFNALEKQWKIEKNIDRREHVMNTLTNNNFDICKYADLTKEFINSLNFDINQLHLSVDTPEDFQLVETIIKHFNNDIFTFNDIIEYLNNNTELVKLNWSESRQKIIDKLKN